jgi:uncharacterized glyoxalase superfamily protein PhnB
MPALRPEGYALVVPFLYVKDIEAALEFYENAFGMMSTNVNIEHGETLHAELMYQDRVVAMLAPEGLHAEAGTAPASADRASFTEFLIYIEDVDACYARAVEAGATGVKEPMDVIWGERLGNVVDPDGYRWLLAQNLNG